MAPKELNITSWKTEPVQTLKERIIKAVQATQSDAIVVPLPNIILMRPDQYVMLQDDDDMLNMFESEDRLYQTPLCVMEVRVETRGLSDEEKYDPAGSVEI